MGRPRPSIAMLTCIALGLGSSGCYRWVDVQPTELTKLDGSRPDAAPRHLKRVDGAPVEIENDADARVHTEAEVAEFSGPVHAELTASTLVVRDHDRRARAFAVQDVKKVELSQYDTANSTRIFVAIALAVVVGSVVVYAVTE